MACAEGKGGKEVMELCKGRVVIIGHRIKR